MKKRDTSYNHPAFPQPNDTSVSLWRYMDFDKFEWLVNNGRLLMPRIDQFDDPFEGKIPRGELHWWQRQADNADSYEQRRIIEHNRSFISQMANNFREQYYLSCWHLNEFENYAMWKCFTKETNAVAVKTEYAALRDCLPSYVHMGLVRYIDYATGRIPLWNLFKYIMHKDIYYRYENEVRAVAAAPFITDEECQRHFNKNHFESEKSPGVLVYAPPIDVTKLVMAVILHPEMPSDVEAKVVALCIKNRLSQPMLSRRKQEE